LPPAIGAETRTPPSRRRGYITFGSFNNFAKISATSIALWAQILAAVPDSKILIKAKGLQDSGLRALVSARFREAGIGEQRLVLAPPVPDAQQHLKTYHEVDIALDTFPYHGTTTTLEALWMNVPVITLGGDRHASRVGVSILSSLGLQQLIAHTPEQYVALAAKLAGDGCMLEEYANGLRARLRASPLMDGLRITRDIEQAYLQMWETACTARLPS
jgi:predicted O-linked N-acetylglucosamine transferase (SPINDLY family)